MVVVESTEALKREILKRMKDATQYAQGDVYKIFNEKMDDFYSEYTPVPSEYGGYIRTYQLDESLDWTGVESIGNGYSADVLFRNGYVNYIGEGYKDDRGLSNEEIIKLNLTGHTHGFAADGTAVWTDPVIKIRSEESRIFKKALGKAGFSC